MKPKNYRAKPAKKFNQLWQEIRNLAKTANKNAPKSKDLTQILVEERDKRYYDQAYLRQLNLAYL